MTRRYMRAAALTATCIAMPAMAQFSDDFDSYSQGPICDQGGWQGWNMDDTVCGTVSGEQANSGANSLKIVGDLPDPFGDDTVHQFTGLEGGAWTFSIMTYVPSDATGRAWVILLNDYEDGQNAGNNWSVQVSLDADAGEVQDDPVNIVPPTDTIGLIFDEWVELRIEIDLDSDSCDYFYNDQLFVENKSWTEGVSGGGSPIIDAIDLYGDEPFNSPPGTSGTYFDDLSIQPAGGCKGDCNGDGILNILDFVCFQAEFQNQTPAGDCDGNGLYNILDFVCFQQAFQAGCN